MNGQPRGRDLETMEDSAPQHGEHFEGAGNPGARGAQDLDATARRILADFRAFDIPGLIEHADGMKSFQPRWTMWEAEKLKSWRLKGIGHAEIGRRLGKSRSAARDKARRMGLL